MNTIEKAKLINLPINISRKNNQAFANLGVAIPNNSLNLYKACEDIATLVGSSVSTEASQDAVGQILLNTSSVSLTYNDSTPSISATALPAGINHDALLNFSASKHVDHSTLLLNTSGGLTGGGDLTTSRTISIADTAVTPSTYGSSSSIPVLAINSKGQITTASNSAVNITASQISDFAESTDDRVANLLTAGSNITLNYNDVSNTLTISGANSYQNIYNSSSLITQALSVNFVAPLIATYNGGTSRVDVTVDPTLSALSTYNTNGILTQTAADTFTGRTLTGSARVSVSNGNGVAGNPTIDLSASGVTAATYGTASSIPSITVDTYGRATSITTNSVSISSSQVTDFSEGVDDRVASLLTAGSGITLSYNDVSNTLTIASTGGYTDENSQDAIGGILTDTPTIDFTYDDLTPTISASVIDNSITFAKIQDIPTSTLVGRYSASTGDAQSITLGAGLSLSGGGVLSSSSTGAPVDATYLTTSSNGTLTHERVLTSGDNIDVIDNGANSTFVINALKQKVTLSGIISPPTLTADQNDYNPSGLSTASTIRISSDSSYRAIKGLQGGESGRVIFIENVGANPLTICGENTSSSAANRFKIKGEIILTENEVLQVKYDSTLSRWIPIAFPSIKSETPSSTYYTFSPGSLTTSNYPTISLSATLVGSVAPTGIGPAAINLNTSTSSAGFGLAYFIRDILTYGRFGSSIAHASSLFTVNNISSPTDRYIIQTRLTTTPNSSNVNENSSVGIRYSDNINGGNWECYSRSSGGSETVLDSGVAFNAHAALANLKIYVNKSCTEARFYINNSFVGAITTNLPTAGSNYGAATLVTKTAGTNQIHLLLVGKTAFSIY
jgi:hypothetical protein